MKSPFCASPSASVLNCSTRRLSAESLLCSDSCTNRRRSFVKPAALPTSLSGVAWPINLPRGHLRQQRGSAQPKMRGMVRPGQPGGGGGGGGGRGAWKREPADLQNCGWLLYAFCQQGRDEGEGTNNCSTCIYRVIADGSSGLAETVRLSCNLSYRHICVPSGICLPGIHMPRVAKH